jgi:hypothetical protein
MAPAGRPSQQVRSLSTVLVGLPLVTQGLIQRNDPTVPLHGVAGRNAADRPTEVAMARTASPRRPSPGTRRAGYVVAAVVNAAMLYVINVWPGWQAVPFLTGETRQVLGLVNLSVVVGLVANLVYLANDAPWLKSLGDLVTTAVGLVVIVQVWLVFPFSFDDWSADWSWLVRLMLVVAGVGASIGIVVQFVSLIGRIAHGGVRSGPSSIRR